MRAELPSALLRAANLEERNLSEKVPRLLALKLYREDKVWLERAADSETIPAPGGSSSAVGGAQHVEEDFLLEAGEGLAPLDLLLPPFADTPNLLVITIVVKRSVCPATNPPPSAFWRNDLSRNS